MKRWLAMILLLGACGGGAATAPAAGTGTGAKLAPRAELHCTPQAVGDEAACHARGADCTFGPGMVCSGVQLPPEFYRRRDEAIAAGTLACVCECEAERTRCMMVP